MAQNEANFDQLSGNLPLILASIKADLVHRAENSQETDNDECNYTVI